MYSDEYDDQFDSSNDNEENDSNKSKKNNFNKNNASSGNVVIYIVLVVILLVLLYFAFGKDLLDGSKSGKNGNSNNSNISYKVEISPAVININVGGTLNIGVVVYDSNNIAVNNPYVTWKIDDDSLANIEGNTINAIAPGETFLTATYTDSNGKMFYGTKSIVVTGPPEPIAPTSITINKDITSIKVGETAKIDYSFDPIDASDDFSWTSSDPSILSVDSNGNITALGSGSARITLSSTVDDNILDTIDIIVESNEIEKIEFNQFEIVSDINNQATMTIEMNTPVILTPVITPTNVTNPSLTFTPTDPTIVNVILDSTGTSATITGIKVGTTELVVKSNNNIENKVIIMVVKPSSSSVGSSGSSKHCYCNSYSNCQWSSGANGDYKDKQSRIPNSTACTIYSNNYGQACFKDSNDNYKWGKYGNDSSYTFVSGVTSMSSCKSTSSTIESLSCSNVYKGETGNCVLTTTSDTKIKSASSSNENIVKIKDQSSTKITYECVDGSGGQKSATISAISSSGKTISRVVLCKDKSSINLICASSKVVKGESVNCSVSGIISESQLESCESSRGSATKSGKNCVVTYDSTGSITVTAKTSLGSVNRTIEFVKSDKTMDINCPASATVGDTVSCTVKTDATGVSCSSNYGTASYSGGKCTVKYAGTTAREVTVTFKSSETSNYTRKINFTSSKVKKVTVYCPPKATKTAVCTISNPDNASLSYTVSGGATKNCSGGSCTISFAGSDTNITLTVSSTDIITDTGKKSISKVIFFNPTK